VADNGRKARREAAHGAMADKPKRYEPAPSLQDPGADCRTFAPQPIYLTCARITGRACCSGMNNIAATLVIRERLRQRVLPHGEHWRCQGEYAGGCVCDGCGERITSAQASYEVDFAPGITPESVKLHRACFEIWRQECQSPPLPANGLNAPVSTPP
jgi:hypothetical protein